MGFSLHKAIKHVTKAAKTVVHDVTHPQDVIKTAVHGVEEIGHAVKDVAHGDFKKALGDVSSGLKHVLDPGHLVGAAHEAARPITNPVNKALAQGIKGLTGHNVLGSHPLNTVGTVVAGIATAGAGSALMGGASLAGSLSAGMSALESTGASIVGGVGSGLSAVGLDTAGTAVSGWASALDAAAASSMAASGSIAGQMGLSGSQAMEMNIGSGLTHAGQSVGNNMVGHLLSGAGDKLTGAVSDQLAAGTGHALGSFGFAKTASGGTEFVQGTLNEVAKATNNFGSTGVFANSWKDALETAAGKMAGNAAGKAGQGQSGAKQGSGTGQDDQGLAMSGMGNSSLSTPSPLSLSSPSYSGININTPNLGMTSDFGLDIQEFKGGTPQAPTADFTPVTFLTGGQ